MRVLMLVLSLASVTGFMLPSAAVHVPRTMARQQPATMNILGPKKSNFDPDSVSEEAQKKTVTRLGVVWGVIGVTVAAITSSGKSFDRMNAPGYAEQAAKKQAGKQAIIDKAKAEKEAMRAKRAAAAATQ